MSHRRLTLAGTAVACLLLTGCGGGSSQAAIAPTSTPPVSPSGPTSADAGPDTASPAGVTCSDVGGVFVAHGTDGRGDCEPADRRAKCHIPPAQQDGNYLAELTMTPPFPQGSIDYPFMIATASNADCWKQPPANQ